MSIYLLRIMTDALIALGANLAPEGTTPAAALESALELLCGEPGLAVARQSRWFRSPAFPPGSGPDFVNGAAVLNTGLPPESVLEALHRVEARLGRARTVRWGPRVCDLDLLGEGATVAPDRETVARWMALPPDRAGREAPDRLILPHPRLHERAFVLVPLAQIAPRWRHPVLGRTVTEMLAALPARDLREITPL